MKTCEQYVLKKLEEAERKVDEQEEFIKILKLAGEIFFEYAKVVNKHIKIQTSSNGKLYAEMEYVFEEFSPEEFKRIQATSKFINRVKGIKETEENKGAD